MIQLHNYINRYSQNGISKDDFEIIKGYFLRKKLRKKQYFLQEGDVCRYFGFIVKGAMRQYTVDEKGAEHVVQLSLENWWIGDRESYTMFTPSVYNIDAWEDTELLLVSRSNILELFERFPAISEMLRILDDKNSVAKEKRITSSISASAEKRYLDFITCYPEFVERFPQHIIASYLGISKDTLSRIKHQLLEKTRLK